MPNSYIDIQDLIGTLCSEFVNLRGDELDPYVRASLQKVGTLFDLDRCLFYRIDADGVASDRIEWVREELQNAPDMLDAAGEFPWAIELWRRGETLCFSRIDEVPSAKDRAGFQALQMQSLLAIPLTVDGRRIGAVGFARMRAARPWLDDEIKGLTLFGHTLGVVIYKRQSDRELSEALDNIRRLTERLEAENVFLRSAVVEQHAGSGIVGESATLMHALRQVHQVAATDSTVLLLGETGTGKKRFAAEIHRLSARHDRPMVTVNCSAIQPALIDGELFGRETGALAGATTRQVGRFELADQSTIFLDEIGELPEDVQVKLLRVLDERRLERIGNPQPIPVNVRVIAASHFDLHARAAAGQFRHDLFYRLNVFPIHVPALRERHSDIPLLVRHFVGEFSHALGKHIDAINPDSLGALQRYAWPGNIRELRNVVERAMIVATGPLLDIPVPDETSAAIAHSTRLIDVERTHIRNVLLRTGWRIRGEGGAAEQLGMKPTTLESRLLKLGLHRQSRRN